ncbi:MAG: hypothetical protein V7637_6003 [Mycobacteriales bacterium]
MSGQARHRTRQDAAKHGEPAAGTSVSGADVGGRPRRHCVYDAPDPAAIRAAGEVNGLPVDQITEVSVLDPYFYH